MVTTTSGVHETLNMTELIVCHGTLLIIQCLLLSSQYNYHTPIEDIMCITSCCLPLLLKCFWLLSQSQHSGWTHIFWQLQGHQILQNLSDETLSGWATAIVVQQWLNLPAAAILLCGWDTG
jgi:hypothetical protein